LIPVLLVEVLYVSHDMRIEHLAERFVFATEKLEEQTEQTEGAKSKQGKERGKRLSEWYAVGARRSLLRIKMRACARASRRLGSRTL